jgi:hypothetical protein
MYEQAKKTLKINLQTNLIQLEDQKCTVKEFLLFFFEIIRISFPGNTKMY